MKTQALCVYVCVQLPSSGDCSPPGSSVHGILQARIPECVAIPVSRGSSPSRGLTQAPCIAGRLFTSEPLEKPTGLMPPRSRIRNRCLAGVPGRGPQAFPDSQHPFLSSHSAWDTLKPTQPRPPHTPICWFSVYLFHLLACAQIFPECENVE